MRELNPSKTIIALGNYGYDWTSGKQEADEVTFQEALIHAGESQATPIFDPTSRNPYYEYDENDGSHHTVWFLDAVTAYNQMRAASGYKPAGFAIWRLGSEDPSVWSVRQMDHRSSRYPEAGKCTCDIFHYRKKWPGLSRSGAAHS